MLIVNGSFEGFTVGLKRIDEETENLPELRQYLFETNLISVYFYAMLFLQNNIITSLVLCSKYKLGLSLL